MTALSATDPLASLSPAWARVVNDVIVRGEGVYLYAKSGKRYLDFTSGIGVANTGHCHPAVVEAIKRQAERLLFGQMNCVVPETALELSDALRPKLPTGIDSFFFANSGAEAVEGAVKLARIATGKPNVIALEGGFHGRTAMTMALTSSKTVYRAGYQPLPAGVFFAPFPYALNLADSGVHFDDEERLVAYCLARLEHVLASQSAPSETAAVLLEPVLGEGGYVPASTPYLRGLRELCDRHGLLLVVDEIQSGFGRTGDWWYHTRAGVTPDILTVAKGIASGLPMSAIAAPRDLMAKMGPGMHGGTYGGGSAIAQAAAVATIDVIEREELAKNATELGAYLTGKLQAIAAKHPALREVRGPGLMVGCEFAAGAEGKAQAGGVAKRCAAAGLLLLTCGTHGNVVRWIPPLVVATAQLDEGLGLFEQAITQVL
ncbi:5-aminovalerate aminotransferase DavT [Botrimarina colliarenosi]|uniref:5-aminovalerate aminotransferase DavT n=1 Tax=Botrimarina colliarenosi TaxID=2528001 RepID=A0A5C6AG78_9BACT|nr:aminotransferase class III-fold pyridoxal phosphate-dependent enzyme [Botrimarina colliarenosi]TWT98195.1 5-aminovalerate aminotransferase DavT [Botrimarina colliarenosi]